MDRAPAAPPANLFRQLRIKSRQIMLLDALDEHRNLRRAAAAIHTTQPAATALLQQLEEGLGVPLFHRHARGMEPTLYGEVMIRYARSVLHDFEHAGSELAALAEGQAGLVRIGTVMGAMPVILTSALARFKDGHPKVRVTLQVDTSDLLIPALVRGDLDVVLGRLPDQFQGGDLEIESMEGEAMAVVARPGHALFDKPSLKVADLVAQS
jgi:DNA-binding transcriptional LysR family regulator